MANAPQTSTGYHVSSCRSPLNLYSCAISLVGLWTHAPCTPAHALHPRRFAFTHRAPFTTVPHICAAHSTAPLQFPHRFCTCPLHPLHTTRPPARTLYPTRTLHCTHTCHHTLPCHTTHHLPHDSPVSNTPAPTAAHGVTARNTRASALHHSARLRDIYARAAAPLNARYQRYLNSAYTSTYVWHVL